MLSIWAVHLQYDDKITPKCLWEVIGLSKLSSHIILSSVEFVVFDKNNTLVLLGLNLISHCFDHKDSLCKSLFITVSRSLIL